MTSFPLMACRKRKDRSEDSHAWLVSLGTQFASMCATLAPMYVDDVMPLRVSLCRGEVYVNHMAYHAVFVDARCACEVVRGESDLDVRVDVSHAHLTEVLKRSWSGARLTIGAEDLCGADCLRVVMSDGERHDATNLAIQTSADQPTLCAAHEFPYRVPVRTSDVVSMCRGAAATRAPIHIRLDRSGSGHHEFRLAYTGDGRERELVLRVKPEGDLTRHGPLCDDRVPSWILANVVKCVPRASTLQLWVGGGNAIKLVHHLPGDRDRVSVVVPLCAEP